MIIRGRDLIDHKGHFKGLLSELPVPVRRAEVPGLHVRLQKQRVLVCLESSELADPLERLPVLHAGVVESRGDQEGGVRLGLDVRVGAVLLHVLVEGALVGVAPLLPLRHRQRNRGVRHSVETVEIKA